MGACLATGLRGWEKEWVVVGGGIWLGAGEEGVSNFCPEKNFALIIALQQLQGREEGQGEDRRQV